MFASTKAYSGFAVPDLEAARRFYGETLGLRTSVPLEGVLLALHLAGDRDTLIYHKPDHESANYTILNFEVDDVERAVDELSSRGVRFERYEGFDQDEKGIARGQGAHDRVVHRPGGEHPGRAREDVAPPGRAYRRMPTPGRRPAASRCGADLQQRLADRRARLDRRVRGGRALEREPPSDYRTQGPAAPSASARSVNPRSSSGVTRCWRIEGAITRRGQDRLDARTERGPSDDCLLGQRPLAAPGERCLRRLDGRLGEQPHETSSWRAAAVWAIANEKPALCRQRWGAARRSASGNPGRGNLPREHFRQRKLPSQHVGGLAADIALHRVDLAPAGLRLVDMLYDVDLAVEQIDPLALHRKPGAAVHEPRPAAPGSTTVPSKPSARTSSLRIASR
jgi:catechol 2,3-dioxygenase-like lactoylglutathione lyase family enzyme